MKISVLVILPMLFICVIGRHATRVQREIHLLETFTNTSTKLVNYIKDKGRSLKTFLNDNVKIPYVNGNNEDINEDKEMTMFKKFKGYIEKAKDIAGTVYDIIAPAVVEHQCVDNSTMKHMTTPQLTAMHGYVSESHTIVTDDGYILTVHRIPYSKYSSNRTSSNRTVLLHHGLLASSADWVIPGPGRGLAYILSDAGYDVWLANVRGNTYSRAHVSRNINTYEFWNFTFHEVSQYDLPAVIDYIVNVKGSDVKLDYVGFSMGTTVLFALLSTKTQYNDILRAGFALAPVAYMKNLKSPIKAVAKYSDKIDYMMKLFGANEFLPRNAAVRYLSKHSCRIKRYEEALCEISMFTLCGHDRVQFDRSLMPMILSHVPAGASTKTLTHYGQEIKADGHFQYFDYGLEGNMIQYGRTKPPEYPVDKITLPIALFSGEDDWLSSIPDAVNLYSRLANPIEHYVVPLKEFNHLNFLFAVDAPTLVYNKLLQLMETSYNSVQPNYHDQINI